MVIKLIRTDVITDDRTDSFVHPERFHDFHYIGGGSFGRVVSAKDTVRDDYMVAIKKISVQRHANARMSDVKNLLREVVILRYAKNPQIVELVSIYMELQDDIEKVPVSIYIVMKYCGENLVDYMAKNQDRLPLGQAAEIVYNIARGLNFLHKLEIYHRDLKPNNICIDENDGNFRAKIIDLGYARKKPHDTNEITSMIATVCYRAPENLFGLKFKEKQDVWSLGCILGYLASSKNIFRYMRRELKESSGTLQLILRYLGKPSINFINNLNENRTSIDRLLWRDFNKLFEADNEEHGHGFDTFLERHENDPKRGEALDLMNGMLKWHHEERLSIQDIIESDFVAEFRDERFEKLPPPDLVTMIKEILDENEDDIKEYQIRKDYNGLIQNYLYTYIAEEFGYDEDVKDHYSYSPSSE
ncbi:cyclin-dependent kinase 2-like isoform X2 [Bolinopsis microptera]|uniref:cyclin-dependent kinase 2-like isoform X2 n=1 Tax=Bolinopsis microptera TaxID=2820187 RepID=UPI003079E1A8